MNRLTISMAYARALARESRSARLDLLRIASRLGLEVRQLEADGFDGALIRAREVPCGTIVIRKSIREQARKRFTLAHELGHFLLPGHDGAGSVCTKSDVGNWRHNAKRMEREADEFAAELLLPADAVRSIIDRGDPSLQLIERIAKRFRTSFSAAAWRYCDLAREPCAIVWSINGRIDWSKRSEKFAFSLSRGVRVEPGTFAARAFAGEPYPKQPESVSAGLWIPSSPRGAELREQAKALPAYRSVISLLLA